MHDPLSDAITPEQFRRVRALFEAALELPVTDRGAWLEAACGGDEMLVRHVERMLAATSQRHHLLDLNAEETHEADRSACVGCGAIVTRPHPFCPSCGTPAAAGVSLHEGRFRSGALFAGRFRIVALEGRGGMGEVYRAHDLELGQPVALKFLTALPSDQRARKRLRTEVRLARQVSHPNVCRVYDIGEANGELYLSMEYVEGEDLAALLKRIGRVPVHKGLDIARKICAGLAAAHARGVLHRDLKPGNIMLDTHGEARILDFGLAAVAGQLDPAEVRSGTAAYMAPEQLEGREATVRSDIYALGLVLFELLTGRPAFEGTDAAEFLRLRGSHPSTTPTTLVRDLDPAIERTILRCLEPDPHLRPASALEVAASLPGGDPLAEALAAGETPSPELVAAAGPDIVMRPTTAVALLAVIGAALAGVLLLTEQTQMVSMVPMENSPEVLASKAREFVRTLGYPQAAHVAYGFRDERGYRAYVAGRISHGGARLRQWRSMLAARPAPVSFWYAQSDGPLVPPGATSGAARPIDSLPAILDVVSVDLDLDGRLLRFKVSAVSQGDVQPQSRDATHPAGPRESPLSIPTGKIDWQRFFTVAGLDLALFTETDPPPSSSGDTRVTWTGSFPGRSDLPVRIEGGTTATTVTSFEVLFPWTNRDPMLPQRTDYRSALLLIIIWVAPCLVARSNWRQGRADVKGALRVGTVLFLAHLGSLLLNAADALNAFLTRPVFWVALGLGAWAAAVYIALEPWIRRWWPHAMIGWARVVAGRWRDPIVARDVLVALAFITVYRCVYLAAVAATVQAGALPLNVASINAVPGEFVLSHLAGPQFIAANMLSSVTFGIATAVVSFFLLASFRSLLPNRWLRIAAFGVFFYLWISNLPDFRGHGLTMSTYVLLLAICIFAAPRYGLLTLVVATSIYQLMAQSILGTDFGAWYGRSSCVAVLLVSALAIWACRVSFKQRALSPAST
jgi:serine/threonine-protein kinase